MTTLTGVISYPIPAYSNVPIEAQFYQPSQFFISNIVLGPTTIVTTTVSHNYVIGQEIRLIIPPYSGCRQLNGQSGFVISIPSANQVEVNIYSLGGDSFTSSVLPNQPQILAIGDINSGQTNTNGLFNQTTYILGSFINISPL
jgi:hypothetical protein